MTHRGMIIPTRVLMGGTDSVGYCQSIVEEIFRPLLYHGLLAWLNDILGYAKTVLALVSPVLPLTSPEFQWPKMAEIVTLQKEADRPEGVQWSDNRGYFVIFGDKVWIPTMAEDLIERVCVIGHAGASGHRGQNATLQAIKTWCWWESMEDNVKVFVKCWIHFLSTMGKTELRPFGPALHDTKPN